MKPNLFIAGGVKCGTTAWVQYLSSHPDIYFSPTKEPFYFCSDFPGWQQMSTDAEYLSLFEGATTEKVLAEASVWYLFSDVAAKRIRDFNPDAKIIILLREQEKQIPSLHNQALFMTQECIEDFETAWRLSGKRDANNISRFCKEPKFLDYKACGRFAEQVERYFDHFPAEQIRVFHYRDWSKDPRATYLEMMRFLGIEDDGRTDFPPVNEAKHHRWRRLGEFMYNPPRPVRAAARLLRRCGVGGVVDMVAGLLKLGRRKGYRRRVSDELREEIRSYYEADNARLEARIWKPRATKAPAPARPRRKVSASAAK